MMVLPVLAVNGCGNPNSAVVTGKVTHQGKTLAFGTVVLFADDNRPRQGPIAPDGAYRIEGVPYGTARIAVFSAEPGKAAVPRKLPPDIKDRIKDTLKAAPVALDTSKWFAIPDIYNNPETSGLSLRIDKNAIQWDIDLP